MMQRPNLAGQPFLDTRPVVLASAALGVAALVLTAISVSEFVTVRVAERGHAQRLEQLRSKRTQLAAEVEAENRALAAVPWKKLGLETGAMGGVLEGRRLSWSALLADLERVVPWDVRLVSVTPNVSEGGAVGIGLDGYAMSREGWLRLLGRLFADRSFSDPLPQSEEAPDETNGLGYRIRVRATYWPGGRK